MSDNLGNDWGTILCLSEGRSGQHSRGKDILNSCNDELKSLLRTASNGKYRLEKTTTSGTDANLWAVMDVTGGDASCCMFGCGSYVAGDNGPIQSWSTSDFSTGAAYTCILSPNKSSEFAKKVGIALPYHVPCDSCCNGNKNDWLEFENKCLFNIHLKYLESRLSGKPFKALFMELILAGNGAMLSDRFLKHLGVLLKHLGITIVVDEIMTGGRCNDKCLLLTQTTPTEFQAVVSHVTLGKWTGIGIVLRNGEHCPKQYDLLLSRGSVHTIDTTTTVATVKTVIKQMKNINRRREVVLEKILKNQTDMAWGLGLLVFSPKHRTDSGKGLKSRFLPLIDDTPVDRIPLSMARDGTGTSRDCCGMIVGGVKEWLEFSVTRMCEAERKLCTALADKGKLSNQSFDLCKPRQFLKEQFDCKTENRKRKYSPRNMESIVDNAKKQGLLVHLTQGTKVLVPVRAGDICYRPVDWELDLL